MEKSNTSLLNSGLKRTGLYSLIRGHTSCLFFFPQFHILIHFEDAFLFLMCARPCDVSTDLTASLSLSSSITADGNVTSWAEWPAKVSSGVISVECVERWHSDYTQYCQTGTWVHASCDSVETLLCLSPNQEMYRLQYVPSASKSVSDNHQGDV